MKFLEIRQTSGGEIAYLFDEERNKVYRVPVEDYTEGDAEMGESAEVPQKRARIRPAVALEEGNAAPPPRSPLKKRKTIMPPGLAGVFMLPGTPGAAEERRTV